MKFILPIMTVALLTSCMSDREYQLRAKQLENQANHPTTYDLFAVEGPFTLSLANGGKAKVTVPNQPFSEISIPDGVKAQTQLAGHLIDVGAIAALGFKALDNVNTTKNTTNTIIEAK